MRSDDIRTFIYAGVVCIISSLLLSLAATQLKPLQEKNKQLDIQKNILKALGIANAKTPFSEVDAIYKNVEEIVLDKKGNELKDLPASSISDKMLCKMHPADWDSNPEDCKMKVYAKKENGSFSGYAFPIEGQGLWSRLYGYMALEKDANTVMGLSFYAHGETPGLGAEIEAAWFSQNFVGKKILDSSGNFTSVTIAKGKAANSGIHKDHVVDGISGATFTGVGVNALIKHCLEVYEPFFKAVRKGVKA